MHPRIHIRAIVAEKGHSGRKSPHRKMCSSHRAPAPPGGRYIPLDTFKLRFFRACISFNVSHVYLVQLTAGICQFWIMSFRMQRRFSGILSDRAESSHDSLSVICKGSSNDFIWLLRNFALLRCGGARATNLNA
jgi:hypothetical protein